MTKRLVVFLGAIFVVLATALGVMAFFVHVPSAALAAVVVGALASSLIVWCFPSVPDKYTVVPIMALSAIIGRHAYPAAIRDSWIVLAQVVGLTLVSMLIPVSAWFVRGVRANRKCP